MKTALRIIGFINCRKYKYSQEYEDNFKYMDWKEKLWWGYKFFIRQPVFGEKGKDIEKYFAEQDLNFNKPEGFVESSSIKLNAAGDLNASPHIRVDNTKDMWGDVKVFYFSADIVAANLETPINQDSKADGVPTEFTSAPTLNSSPEMFERFALNEKGINFYATANNHCLDQGEKGLIATLDFLDSKGYPHAGSSRSETEQDDIPLIEKNGIKVGFVSYTYSLNGKEAPAGKEYLTNYIRINKPDTDIEIIRKHVKIAREKGADIVVAMLHWSIEFETYPIKNVIDMGHKIMECGVDIILGGHAHVAQPMEKYIYKDPFTNESRDGFIIYSLGDFISYHRHAKNTKLSWIIGLNISKGILNGKDSTVVSGLKIMPIYIYTGFRDGICKEFKLLRFKELLKQLDDGVNVYGFTIKEINEFKRLEKHLYGCLLPQKHDNLLAE
jgi:poly-gamma-glutamate synthesis protein (capsule biosynthesis protein)